MNQSLHPHSLGHGMTSGRSRDRLVEALVRRGIRDERVLEAIRAVPRHVFLEEALASRAYEDTALPIGHGQTISQPYSVALMTEKLIEHRIPQRVLEVGSGCGYQTAVLAQLVERVVAVERIGPLYSRSRQQLHALGIRNVTLRHADGTDSGISSTSFDGILAAAAADEVPPELVAQLSTGGRLILPVGPAGAQKLICVDKTPGGTTEEVVANVSFVPLLSGAI